MKIQLERGGGLVAAATRRSVSLDTDDLSTHEAARLRDLVAAADLPSLAVKETATAARPDAFHYRLVVEDSGRRYQVDAADPDLSPELRALVNWVMKR